MTRRYHAPADRRPSGAARSPRHGLPAWRAAASARSASALVERRRAHGRRAVPRGDQSARRVSGSKAVSRCGGSPSRGSSSRSACSCRASRTRSTSPTASCPATDRFASACGRCLPRGPMKRRSITRYRPIRSWWRRRGRLEVRLSHDLPPVRLLVLDSPGAFTVDALTVQHLYYRVEESRGYQAQGDAWSPGYFRVDLEPGAIVTFVASTESWETMTALPSTAARDAEIERRRRLLVAADPSARRQFHRRAGPRRRSVHHRAGRPRGRLRAGPARPARKPERLSPAITGSPTGAATR